MSKLSTAVRSKVRKGLQAVFAWTIRQSLKGLVRTMVVLRVHGLQQIQGTPAVLFVANHVSFLDALLVAAAMDRPVSFVAMASLGRGWWAEVFQALGVIAVPAGGDRAALREFSTRCREVLAQGRSVCIFAEGAVSRTGQLQGFRRGAEWIAREDSVQVHALHIQGVENLPFAVGQGRPRWKPWSMRARVVHVRVGEALPPRPSAFAMRQAVQELGAENFRAKIQDGHTLGGLFLRSSRKLGGRMLYVDNQQTFTARRASLQAATLAAFWQERFFPGERVGVLLPESAEGAILSVSLTLSSRVPVPLASNATPEDLRQAISQADVRTVLTTRELAQAQGRMIGARLLYLEDIAKRIRFSHRLHGWLASRILPISWALRLLSGRLVRSDDLAALLFAQGVSGEAIKGVPLTHRNLLANLAGIRQVFRIESKEVLSARVSMSNAFGFTTALWLPVACHGSMVLSANMDPVKELGPQLQAHKVSVLLALSSQLQSLKDIPNSQRCSLRQIVTGGDATAQGDVLALEEQWRIPVRCGYGIPECSPVIAVNAPGWEGFDLEGKQILQEATRPGSVGRPLPGVAVRIVSASDAGIVLDHGEVGSIQVCGDTVMRSYWASPAATANRFLGKWFSTGDQGWLDEEGFLHLVGWQSPFHQAA